MSELQGTTVVLAATIGAAVVAALVLVLFAVTLPRGVLRAMRGPLQARVAARHRPDEILLQDLTANSFGRESAGRWQLRGNGALVLTEAELHFFQFTPQTELRIPLGAITDVTFTRRHLGKATIFDLLKVHFTLDGRPDSIAWYLAEPPAWKSRIEALKARG